MLTKQRLGYFWTSEQYLEMMQNKTDINDNISQARRKGEWIVATIKKLGLDSGNEPC